MFSTWQIYYQPVKYSQFNLQNGQLWIPKIWLQPVLTLVIEH